MLFGQQPHAVISGKTRLGQRGRLGKRLLRSTEILKKKGDLQQGSQMGLNAMELTADGTQILS